MPLLSLEAPTSTITSPHNNIKSKQSSFPNTVVKGGVEETEIEEFRLLLLVKQAKKKKKKKNKQSNKLLKLKRIYF